MEKITIQPAGEGCFPLSQQGELLPTGLVFVEYAMVDGKPYSGTITQATAEENGIVIYRPERHERGGSA